MRLLYFLCLLFLSPLLTDYAHPEDIAPEKSEEQRLTKRIVTFGCLLPLSGKYRVIGEKALRGVLAAAKSGTPGFEYQIIVKDIGDGEKKLRSALRSLTEITDLSFIVGPIPGKFIGAVSAQIDLRKIPTVVFPVSEDEATGGPYLIKFYYPVEKQVEVLSRYAVKELGVRTFGVLYPKTELGEKLKESFSESVSRAGGEITYTGSYSPGSRDISGEIQWITSINPNAIFIPDGASSSAELISKLKRSGKLRDVLFIGPNTWNSRVFLDLIGGEIDGFVYRAIFTDIFFFGDSEWREFTRVFESEFEETPGLFEFQFYNAVKLILTLPSAGAGNGKAMMESLQGLKNDSSYEIKREKNGSLRISPRYRVLSVSDGELIDIMKVK